MKCEVSSLLAVTAPRGFKIVFLIVIALVIPGFFLLVWLMSRSQRGKKNKPPK
jgi:cell division protein FtsX